MISHAHLGLTYFGRLKALQKLIANDQVLLGGNKKLKIYGKLNCKAGKRMKPANRIFFADENEAQTAGYRPCSICLPNEYKLWKQNNETK